MPRDHIDDDDFDDIFDDGENPADNNENDQEWVDGEPLSETENLKPREIVEVEVNVLGVFEHTSGDPNDIPQDKYFVLLADNAARRVAIWIGKFEAYSISMALEHTALDRPMTHDLIVNILGQLDAKVDKILIDDIWQDTYYAKITLSTPNGIMEIDSRPSDAIAIGLRANAPIFMADSVLEQSSLDEGPGI